MVNVRQFLRDVIGMAREGWWARGSPVICFVSATHILTALVTLISPESAGATSMIALLGGMHALDSPDGARFMCATMLFTGTLSLVAALFPVGPARLAMFLPQHLMLAVMALGGLAAAWHGEYLDGTIIPRAHIFTDQIWLSSVWCMHMNAILRRSGEK